MLSFHTWASLKGALDLPLPPELRALLVPRIARLPATGLAHLTHLIIIEPGDTEADVVPEIGFSPLVNPLDRARYGSPSFQPFWDELYRHGGWFELIVTVGNSGFAVVVFIPDAPGVEPDLLALCRTYARRG